MTDFPEFSLLITHDRRLFDQVYGRLRSAIVTGYFDPGTRLVERDLTEKLQVSRTPIREALRRLEQDGLIVCYPHRGYYVRTPSLDEARQAYEVRRALEGLAAELAAERASAEDLVALRELVRKGKAALKAGDHANLLLINNELHLSLVRATGNSYLEQQFRTLWACVDLLRGKWWGTSDRPDTGHSEHEAMVDALVKRDAALARRLSEAHVAHAWQSIAARLTATSEPAKAAARTRR